MHAIFLKSTAIPDKKQKTIKWNVLVRTIALKRGHTRSQRSKAPQITINACEFSFSREKIVSNFCLSEQCLARYNLWIGKPVACMAWRVLWTYMSNTQILTQTPTSIWTFNNINIQSCLTFPTGTAQTQLKHHSMRGCKGINTPCLPFCGWELLFLVWQA